MRALITGHRGFVGSHLLAALQADGRYVIDALDIKPANGDGFPQRDCRDFFANDQWEFDLVLHCAATVGGREGIDHNAALLGANNLQLDGAMFEWALRARPGRIVYFSSAAAYPTGLQGHDRERGLAEDEARPGAGFPDESYGWTKLTGEVIAQRVRAAGVPVTVVRPFSSYAEDQDDCYPFPEFIHRAARSDDPFVVWGDGTQVRDFIHINDLVAAILTLARESVDGPVNLGTGVGTSMTDLARLCMSTAGYTAPIRYLTEKPTGVERRVADSRLLKRYYTPKITLEQGVARALGV